MTDVNQNSSSPSRRTFIKLSAFVTGSLAAIFPFAVGLPAFFSPLRDDDEPQPAPQPPQPQAPGRRQARQRVRRRRRGRPDDMIRVASLSAVPDDGVPRLFTVVADRTDAWNHFPSEPIGAVYLIRKKGADTPTAFTATCPHLGCFVGFDAGDAQFHCPCHTSAFALDGAVLGGPSPRGLDTLPCTVEGDNVLVEFERFQTGTPEKIVKA